MNILTVIPISRGISKETLTYFSKESVPAGSLVSIPLRGKKISGLVTDVEPAENLKSELKTLAYSIRKIEHIHAETFLDEAFVKSARTLADYYATTVGAVLYQLVPKTILENCADFCKSGLQKSNKTALDFPVTDGEQKKPLRAFHEINLVQADNEERYATYKSVIREEFAKGRSVFFCLPTTEDLQNARATLEKGIEKYTHTLHGSLSKKETVSGWKSALSETHPVLILATGSFLSLPRGDIGTIILEKENSRGWKTQSRPYLDMRTVATTLAKASGIRLILGDVFLRIETLWKEKNREGGVVSSELLPLKFRSLSRATFDLVDMRQPADMKKKEFAVLGEELKKMLTSSVENNEHTFLFCGRKGLYPHTVCSDCGTIVACTNCKAPVTLYGTPVKNPNEAKKNLFVCHACGERRGAHELCKHCGGWRLLPLGIGIEKVLEEVTALLPNASAHILSADHIKTHKQAVTTRNTFYATPGAILLGTEMALPYLKENIENTAVVSMDSFFSIPDFRISEKIFHIVLSLRNLAEKKVIVQTRREDKKIFDSALRGNLIEFYRSEIEDRKVAGFAPYALHIKLTMEGEKTAVKKQMQETHDFLQPFDLICFDAWKTKSNAPYAMHGVIALSQGVWPNAELTEKLRALSPKIAIKVDPDTLL